MSRVLDIPDNALVEEIKTLERDLFEIKTRQFMGYDVVKVKTNSTSDASDFSVAGSGFDSFQVKFTSDIQPRPTASLRFTVWRGSVGTLASLGSFDISIQDTTWNTTPDNEATWFINVNNNDSGTIFLKAFVLATDTGEVEII